MPIMSKLVFIILFIKIAFIALCQGEQGTNEQGTGSVHELVFDERQPVPSVHSLIFRTVLVSPSLRLCFPIDAKAKFYRCQSEGKAKFYRTSIEDLSNIYRRPIEEGVKWERRGSREGAEREQRKNLTTKLQNYEVSFSPFWSLVSLFGTFWHFLVVSVT